VLPACCKRKAFAVALQTPATAARRLPEMRWQLSCNSLRACSKRCWRVKAFSISPRCCRKRVAASVSTWAVRLSAPTMMCWQLSCNSARACSKRCWRSSCANPCCCSYAPTMGPLTCAAFSRAFWVSFCSLARRSATSCAKRCWCAGLMDSRA